MGKNCKKTSNTQKVTIIIPKLSGQVMSRDDANDILKMVRDIVPNAILIHKPGISNEIIVTCTKKQKVKIDNFVKCMLENVQRALVMKKYMRGIGSMVLSKRGRDV